jgi:TolB-like protein
MWTGTLGLNHSHGKPRTAIRTLGPAHLGRRRQQSHVLGGSRNDHCIDGIRPRTLVRSGISVIVVLPFANMSRDLEQEYFSDGITEDIITDLSKVIMKASMLLVLLERRP